MMQINLVLGSSREKSLGRRVFNYLKNHRHDFEQQNAVHLNFLAVGDYQLPFFYEDVAPMNNQDRHLPAQQQAWLDDMEQASGYIFITPEYNHSFPAVLKNGLDYLAFQTAKKPALIMSYSDNARAGQFGGVDLTPVLTRLGMTVLPPLVGIGNVQKNFNEAGEFLENAPSKDFYHQKLQQTVEKIAFYSRLFADNPFTPQS